MDYYKNKTVLITGASSGIGESFAITLDKLGAKLILTARSKDKLEKMTSEMNNAISIPGDLSDKKFPQQLYNSIKEKNIDVDILINNAGFGFSGLFLDSSMKNYNEMMNLNVYSLVALTHLFLNEMVIKKNGGIINISSLASFQPMPFFSIYAASKAFVTSFTVSIYEEYRKLGIKVLGVCPGYTKTNFNKRAQMNSIPVAGYLMSSQEVVDQSLKAYQSGKFLIVNGKINKFLRFITSIIPTKLSLAFSSSVIKRGITNRRW